jgi:hypothetical protein
MNLRTYNLPPGCSLRQVDPVTTEECETCHGTRQIEDEANEQYLPCPECE